MEKKHKFHISKRETPAMEISSLIELGIGPSIEDSKNNCIIVNCDVKCQGIDADKMMNYFNRFYSEVRLDLISFWHRLIIKLPFSLPSIVLTLSWLLRIAPLKEILCLINGF